MPETTAPAHEGSDTATCYVCKEATPPLVRPCACTGGTQWIHWECQARAIRMCGAHVRGVCPVCRTAYTNVRVRERVVQCNSGCLACVCSAAGLAFVLLAWQWICAHTDSAFNVALGFMCFAVLCMLGSLADTTNETFRIHLGWSLHPVADGRCECV